MIVSKLRSDGRHRAKLYVDGGPSTTGTVGHLRMEGREVFKHAVGMVTDVIKACFEAADVSADELDWFVPHQANRRIIEASADKLGIDLKKVVHDRRPARQHLGRLDPARARRRRQRRAHQARRSRDDRGDGRRLHLGRLADPLVRTARRHRGAVRAAGLRRAACVALARRRTRRRPRRNLDLVLLGMVGSRNWPAFAARPNIRDGARRPARPVERA